MVDFEMTNSGDLKLSAAEKYPGFAIEWYESEFPVLRLDWEQQALPPESYDDDGFTLTFNTVSRNNNLAMTALPVRHEKELRQRIAILLRTELGSTPLSPGLGTTLSLDRHEDLCSMQTLKSIQGKVIAAIKDLVENPSVVLKVEEKIGPFYCQNVGIYIYQNNELIYQTSIGG